MLHRHLRAPVNHRLPLRPGNFPSALSKIPNLTSTLYVIGTSSLRRVSKCSAAGAFPGNELNAYSVGKIGPKPPQKYRNSIAKSRKKENMDGAPYPPGAGPCEGNPAEFPPRALTADGRGVSLVPISEGSRGFKDAAAG